MQIKINGKNRRQKALQLIDTAGRMNKVRVYDVEFESSFVRVYIDKDAGDLDLAVCEKFMKSLLFLFQSDGMRDMECEVSSPGLERKLKQDWHFLEAVGKIVKVCTSQPVFCYDRKSEKKRKTTRVLGLLNKYKDEEIEVKDQFLDWTIPLNIITKAHIVFKNKKQDKRRAV